MTLDDLEGQNRGFYGFFGDFGLRHIIHKVEPPSATELSLCALWHDCNKGVVFYRKFPQI